MAAANPGESMSRTQANLSIGQTVEHSEFGSGVITALREHDYAEVFFQGPGSKSVPVVEITVNST